MTNKNVMLLEQAINRENSWPFFMPLDNKRVEITKANKQKFVIIKNEAGSLLSVFTIAGKKLDKMLKEDWPLCFREGA